MRAGAAVALLAAGCLLVSCGSARVLPKTTTATDSAPPARTVPAHADAGKPWPTYGADNGRRRAVSAPGLRPPFRRVWTFYGRALLEFPPVVGYDSVFEESFDGRLHALDPATGRERWRYFSHRCGWSSPALGDGLVFATFIGDPRCSTLRNGAIVAVSPTTGRIRWRRRIGPCESSPLVAGGTVYIGDQNGYVYAFAARTGALRWSLDTGAPIKASAALAGGRLFIGNYAGALYALDARTGKVLWTSSRHGAFYSTGAVDHGRVYVGSLDGQAYAFSARSGAELWAVGLRGYVYASPAVWRGLVLVGSYDHRFYALDGATGAIRWTFDAGAPISGAASVVDGVVYLSTFGHRTYALAARSGRVLERWRDGDYSPAVAGYGRLFLVGLGRIYALAPR